MTDAEYRRWLRNDAARRTVLLEIETDPVRRLSVVPYTTLPTDATPNVRYDALIKGGVGYREQLSLDGGSTGSYASIELHNEDGSLDAWLGDVWRNRAIRIYYGDVSWERSDYRLVAAGVVDRCEQDENTVIITLVDKLEALNEALTEDLLGGPGQYADKVMPYAFGECHNITPVLYNTAVHEYRFSGAGTERVIEVRDNGVVVDFVAIPGGFRLTKSPAGTITASVQGHSVGGYKNRIAPLIELLVTSFGPAGNRFTGDDLDADSLAAFDLEHPEPVGLYARDYITVSQGIVELAKSVGAQPIMSRTGKLRLLRVQLPASGEPVVIRPSDYEAGSLKPVGHSRVIAGVRIDYCRNWTVQQIIENGVPEEHRNLYAQEWLTASATDPSVAAEYRISTESESEPTMLLRNEDAQAEADRRLALWSVPRTVIRVRGFAQLLDLELGQAATVYGDRFGLESGKTGQIVGLYPDWVAGRCDVEVLI